MKKITAAAETYMGLRSEMEKLKKLLEAAEAALMLEMESSGIGSTIASGSKITLVEAARSTYDAEALQQMVSPAVFKKVTKPAVDSKKFKAAIEIGQIKADVADAVTTLTPYKSLRVTAQGAATVAVDSKAQVA